MGKILAKGLFMVAGIAGLLAASSAAALADDEVIAAVPFEFIVNGVHMPAGNYQVTQLEGQSFISVKSVDGRHFAFVLTNALAPEQAGPSHLELVFDRVNGTNFLARVVSTESGRDCRQDGQRPRCGRRLGHVDAVPERVARQADDRRCALSAARPASLPDSSPSVSTRTAGWAAAASSSSGRRPAKWVSRARSQIPVDSPGGNDTATIKLSQNGAGGKHYTFKTMHGRTRVISLPVCSKAGVVSFAFTAAPLGGLGDGRGVAARSERFAPCRIRPRAPPAAGTKP